MKTILHQPATVVRRSSKSHPSHTSRMLDDQTSEAIAKIADALAQDRETLLAAVDACNRSTFEEVTRRRARALVLKVWQDLAVAARALAEPVPKFRPNAGNPMPCPRRRPDEDVADLRPAALPSWAAKAVAS